MGITLAATSNVDLAGNGNPTGGNCGEDYTYNTFIIKTSKAVLEGLQKQLSLITCKDFLHMEELPGIHIRNKYGHAKATLAGMLLQSQTGCGGLVKSFIPWGSMTMMAYKAPNCCSQGGLVIGDHLQMPVNVGPVSPEDFESVRSIFSKNVAEDGRRSAKSAAKLTTPKKTRFGIERRWNIRDDNDMLWGPIVFHSLGKDWWISNEDSSECLFL